MNQKTNTKSIKYMSNSNRAIFVIQFLLMVLYVFFLSSCGVKDTENIQLYRERAALLEEQVLANRGRALAKPEASPAKSAGNAVFISVCNTAQRASVFIGTGDTLEKAWESANKKAEKYLAKENLNPVWLKADVVYHSETISSQELYSDLSKSRQQFFRYGVAFDQEWKNAFLEAELNGTKSFDYENGAIDLNYLNHYLEESGREVITDLPDEYTIFQCLGWFCDEDGTVYQLNENGPDYGGRETDIVDDTRVEEILFNASAFLADQVKENGSFVYGIYPRFGNEIDAYNISSHISSIRALMCRYHMQEDPELAKCIQKTTAYMLEQIIYDNEGNAWLYEREHDEIRLDNCAMAAVALTEYMDIFDSDEYEDVCRALGRGILSLLNRKTGEFYHVLNGDFSQKDIFRSVSYDGVAAVALCRLYALTGEAEWIYAARDAVDHFIRADYTQYKELWVAYAMNEITKYIRNDVEYYVFALKNVQVNLDEMYEQDTAYPIYLEFLMSAFEMYDRMMENKVLVDGFDLEMLLKTIYAQADHIHTGYFYPEYAMYMQTPRQVVDSFMVRHDGYRVCIDDIPHDIGAYYLYYTNYDKLVKYGMVNGS